MNFGLILYTESIKKKMFKKNDKPEEIFGFAIEAWPDPSPLKFDEDVLFSEKPAARLEKGIKELPEFFIMQNPGVDISEMNTDNFRCDEFTKVHKDLHIVFSGCSHTFGTGLLKEETWAYSLYNKISKKYKCSGYFNLGFPGSSVMHQVIDLIKYCESYGMPDYIFYNMTELKRLYTLKTNPDGTAIKPEMYTHGFYTRESLPILRLLAYQAYYILEKYCKSNNIKLISFSWKEEHWLKRFNFETFNDFDQKDLLEYIRIYKEKNPDKLCIERARDNRHYGTAYHEFWSEFIYDIFIRQHDNTGN